MWLNVKILLNEVLIFWPQESKIYEVSLSSIFHWHFPLMTSLQLQAQTSMMPSRLARLCFGITFQARTPVQTVSPSSSSWQMDGPRLGRCSLPRSWATLAQPCRRSSASSPLGLGTTWITGCWSACLWKTVAWWDASMRRPTPAPCWKGESVLRLYSLYVVGIILPSHLILLNIYFTVSLELLFRFHKFSKPGHFLKNKHIFSDASIAAISNL